MEKKQEMALVKFGVNPNEIIQEDGRYWMTAEEIGKALGYRHPSQSIRNLYNRHKDELEPYQGQINLVTPSAKDNRGGGLQGVLVFNTDGMWLLAILASTHKAKKFRKFIVNMLKALERDEFIHVSQIEHWKNQTDLWKKELIELKIGKQIQDSKVMDRDKYNKMVRYRGMGLTQRETAKLLDVSRDAIQHFERIARQYELKLVSGGAA